ncbi:hypothetical protein PVNG_02345 [Plasmodium vivax North Korean]|uniref:Type I restriction modification DNA specificity domain-containing protein n=1 Tax=Plasmodium vivax North Korean TaxID=1035514 RepID=A0A0J9TN70_PLAVI|nr:hypothetical protein PVNG_02345 [Plasmodium vivax North Korean]
MLQEYTLGEVCQFKVGTSFKTKDFIKEGTPVLNVSNIKDGKIVADKINYCDSLKFPKANFLDSGDIVITLSGSCGKARNIQNGKVITDKLDYCEQSKFSDANILKNGSIIFCIFGHLKIGINLISQKFLHGQGIIELKFFLDKVDSHYIYHYLSYFVNSKLGNFKSLGSMPHISIANLKKLKIYLPPLEIQKDIARILDKFFSSQSIIEELRELINLERKRYEY